MTTSDPTTAADLTTTAERPSRPRAAALLDDQTRAGFLKMWDTVQSGFVTDPRAAADAAARLVDDLGRAIIRQVESIASPAPEDGAAVAGDRAGDGTADEGTGDGGTPDQGTAENATADEGPGDDSTGDNGTADDEAEKARQDLLRYRAAFHLLIDT